MSILEYAVADHYIRFVHFNSDLAGNFLPGVIHAGKPVLVVLVLTLAPNLPLLVGIVLVRASKI
jgi:hypothetical protein